jgi:hypothetical protein
MFILRIADGSCCACVHALSCGGAGVRRQELALSIEPNWEGFTWRQRQPSFRIVVLNKNEVDVQY